MRQLSKYVLPTFMVGVMFGSVVTLGASAAMKGSAIFTDVVAGSFYDDAVGELYGIGVIKGMDSTHFAPNEPVTRAQVAVMMKRLRDEMNGVTTGGSSTSRSSRSSSSSSASIDPGAGQFQFGVTSINVIENAPKVSLSVSRVGGSSKAVSVKFATSDVSATAGTDYVANNGTLDFAAGETSKVFIVTLKDDSAAEGNEQFKITLSNPTNGATIATQDNLLVTIIDTEQPGPVIGGSSSSGASSTSSSSTSVSAAAGTFEFSASQYAWFENGGAFTITVNRVGGSTGAANVNYATSNSTATSGTDYTATNGTLNFAAGETSKTFQVSMVNNGNIEGNRRFNLTLSTPTGGAALGTQKTAIVTVIDDETITTGSGSLQFTGSNYIGTRGTSVPITVTRLNNHTGTVSTSYTASDGTAVNGTDYTSVSGTITFLPGEIMKSFVVSILTAAHVDRTINLSLMSPSNTILGPDNINATLRID